MDVFQLNLNNIPSPIDKGKTYVVKGKFGYHHYICDGINDAGWGCGYRTLQSLCSWISKNVSTMSHVTVPSIKTIQEILVKLEDKDLSFLNSKDWIGSIEVSLVIDNLFEISSKILHIDSGNNLHKYIDVLCEHFVLNSCPIMMGGNLDCSSKGICGVHISPDETYLLIMDPHFQGKVKSLESLMSAGWIKWHPLSSLLKSSFYNICLPQIKLLDK